MFITNITNNTFKSTTLKNFSGMSFDIEPTTSFENISDNMKIISYKFYSPQIYN